MTRWMILLSVVFWGFVVAAYGVQPALVSSYATGTDNTYLWQSNGGLTAPGFKLNLRQAAIGGTNNCGIFVATGNSSYTFGTPTDNAPGGSNTWIAFATASGGTAAMMKGWYTLGIKTGTTQITVTTSGTASGGTSRIGGWFQELQNCGSIGGNGSGSFTANGASHSITLSAAPTSGDAALGYFLDATGYDVPVQSSAVVPGTGFTAMSNQRSFGKLSEINTATTSTAVSATYANSGDTVLGIGLVVRQGNQGNGAPTAGAFIDYYQAEQVQTATTTFPFPFGGNLVVGIVNSEAQTGNVTGVSGVGCSTWFPAMNSGQVGIGPGPPNQITQIFYGYSCTPSTTGSLTLKFGGTPKYPGTGIALISVKNAASGNPLDTSVSVPQTNQSCTPPNCNLSATTITPTTLNEITFNMATIPWHTLTDTVTDANGHKPRALMSVNTKDDDAMSNCSTATPPSTLDEDNGWSYYINTANTTPITFIYSGTQNVGGCTNNPTGVSFYDAVAVAFKTATSGALPAEPTGLTLTVH